MQQTIFEESLDGITVERIFRDSEFNMMSRHFHNQYEIYYLLDGERYYFIDKETYYVKKGSLVFIDRNQVHKTGTANQANHDRVLVLISADELELFCDLSNSFDIHTFFTKYFGVLELDEKGQKLIEGLLFSIMDELKEKRCGYEFIIKSKIVELLIYSLRCKESENSITHATTVNTDKHKKIHNIAEYIDSNYSNSISLSTVSNDFFMSKSYLSRIFKEVTGFTLNEYINVVRIKKARHLLETTDYSITQIAELTGYDSITYFEKVFKKYIDLSPLKYRKKYYKK